VEETRAVRLARAACSALNLAAFEWTIASGLARCGVSTVAAIEQGAFPAGGYRAGDVNDFAESAKALYDSRDPGKMLANLEGITIEAAFILKDLHRHMEDPVVVRRLREAGTAVLLVEQLIEKALALADRVYALARGSIVLEARTGEADLPHRLEHAYLATAGRHA